MLAWQGHNHGAVLNRGEQRRAARQCGSRGLRGGQCKHQLSRADAGTGSQLGSSCLPGCLFTWPITSGQIRPPFLHRWSHNGGHNESRRLGGRVRQVLGMRRFIGRRIPDAAAAVAARRGGMTPVSRGSLPGRGALPTTLARCASPELAYSERG
ncbi:hypothetical protein SKAU_G00320700 [Synaphobranchus kaupii]|uniref:Uncharacterized protein n=1 Tax=Synaphobranchus kaupii TaxID=118154 RepID=A0A9Q1ENR6_SYNKA|nr:hypothetical protein SKAU_G00320700 [Synaphobranchus kaupii]